MNIGISVFILVYNVDAEKERLMDLCVVLFLLSLCIFLKRHTSYLIRLNFIQNYKIDKYFSYCSELINNIKGLLFSIKNGKILNFNEEYKRHSAIYSELFYQILYNKNNSACIINIKNLLDNNENLDKIKNRIENKISKYFNN
jgi:hypothetical protein